MVADKAPIEVIGSPASLEEQQAEILKAWGADKLIEDFSKKTVDVTEIEQQADAEGKSGSKALLNKEDIELKTELNPVEIMAISRLNFIAERNNIPGIVDFTMHLMELKVSQRRMGRKEFIQGLHAEERRQMGGDLSPLAAALSKVGL